MGDEIAVTGDRPILKLLYLIFSFLDKGPGHGGYRFRIGRRYENAAAALRSSNSRLRVDRLRGLLSLLLFLRLLHGHIAFRHLVASLIAIFILPARS